VPDRDAIEIVTTRNAGFLIPRAWIGALQDVPTENLARLEIWPDRSAIELEGLRMRSEAALRPTAGKAADHESQHKPAQPEPAERATLLSSP
jgi:hypothetical protein